MNISESGDSLVVVDEGDRLQLNAGEVWRKAFFSVATREDKSRVKKDVLL